MDTITPGVAVRLNVWVAAPTGAAFNNPRQTLSSASNPVKLRVLQASVEIWKPSLRFISMPCAGNGWTAAQKFHSGRSYSVASLAVVRFRLLSPSTLSALVARMGTAPWAMMVSRMRAHEGFIRLGRPSVPPDFQADDHDDWFGDTQFAIQRVFSRQAGFRIGPQRGKYRRRVEAASHGLSIRVEMAGKIIDRLLEIGIIAAQGIAFRDVKITHESCFHALAIPHFGKSMRVQAHRLAFPVDFDGTRRHRRDDRPILPVAPAEGGFRQLQWGPGASVGATMVSGGGAIGDRGTGRCRCLAAAGWGTAVPVALDRGCAAAQEKR